MQGVQDLREPAGVMLVARGRHGIHSIDTTECYRGGAPTLELLVGHLSAHPLCLLDVSIWMSNRHVKHNMLKANLKTPSSPH